MVGRGSEKGGNTLRSRTGTENLRISASQLELFFDRVDPAERHRHAQMRRQAANFVMIEEGERTAALSSLESELPELGSTQQNREVLSVRERQALKSSIRSYTETVDGSVNYDEMCQAHMRSLRTQKLFKSRFKAWEAVFREQKKAAREPIGDNFRDSEEFQIFVSERGVEFIRENRKLIIEDTLDSFTEINAEEVGVEFDLDAFKNGVNDFIDRNFEVLISKNEEDKKQVYAEFKKLMGDFGFGGLDNVKIRALFEKIVLTVAFEYLSIQEFRDLNSLMIANVDSDMSEEEWDVMLNEAMEEKYKELEEVVRENAAIAVGGGALITVADGSYGDFAELGRARGVYFRELSGQPGVYVMDSHHIKIKDHLPRVRLQNGYFDMEMVFADKDMVADGEDFGRGGGKSKKFGYEQLQFAVNQQLLEYQLNVESQIRSPETVRENPNSVINDRQMMNLARRLFGFELNQRPLNETHLNRFNKLCKVLMRNNGQAMALRVEKALNFLQDRNNASLVQEILDRENAENVQNIDGLIAYTRMRRSGDTRMEEGIQGNRNRGVRID